MRFMATDKLDLVPQDEITLSLVEHFNELEGRTRPDEQPATMAQLLEAPIVFRDEYADRMRPDPSPEPSDDSRMNLRRLLAAPPPIP